MYYYLSFYNSLEMTEYNIHLTFLADFLQEKNDYYLHNTACYPNDIIPHWAHNGPFFSFHGQNENLQLYVKSLTNIPILSTQFILSSNYTQCKPAQWAFRLISRPKHKIVIS